MGRYYVLSKRLDEEGAAQIISEINSLELVEKAEFNDELNGLSVFAREEDFPAVMDRIVNIINREGDKASLSFRHFVEE